MSLEKLKAVAKTLFKPSTAWLGIFIPALMYYVGNALYSYGLFRSSTYGETLYHEVQIILNHDEVVQTQKSSNDELCSEFLSSINRNSKLLYMQNTNDCKKLRYPIYVVHDDFDDGSIESTAWMEDDELGRGYLLISTSAGMGKIYQWETGGGPIAIGRTLNLKDSGCRSNIYKKCGSDTGSGGIAVDNYRSDSSRRLIVAEYGEGRIVRMEENGARTPLVIETTNSTTGMNERLNRPFQLLMTPFGDLLIIDDTATHRSSKTSGSFQLWRLPEASTVPALPSLAVSRHAHSWNRNNNTGLPHIFFQSRYIGGMVLDTSGQRLYVTAFDSFSSSVLVVSFPLLDDLDDDDEEENKNDEIIMENEDEDETSAEKRRRKLSYTNNSDDKNQVQQRAARDLNSFQSTIVFNYTAHADTPGAIEIDNNGNLYLAVKNGIVVVSKSKTIVAKINFSAGEKIVDLTLGSDRFLYIAMRSKLARIRVPNSPLEIRTELLIKA